jgi:ferredoxin
LQCVSFAIFLFPGQLACAVFGKGRAGKMGAPQQDMRLDWEREICMLCAGCVPFCGAGALTVTETHVEVDDGGCTRCGACVQGCPTGALRLEGMRHNSKIP